MDIVVSYPSILTFFLSEGGGRPPEKWENRCTPPPHSNATPGVFQRQPTNVMRNRKKWWVGMTCEIREQIVAKGESDWMRFYFEETKPGVNISWYSQVQNEELTWRVDTNVSMHWKVPKCRSEMPKWDAELRCDVRFRSEISEMPNGGVEFRCRIEMQSEIPKWNVEVKCRSGMSKWGAEVRCRSELPKWAAELRFDLWLWSEIPKWYAKVRCRSEMSHWDTKVRCRCEMTMWDADVRYRCEMPIWDPCVRCLN